MILKCERRAEIVSSKGRLCALTQKKKKKKMQGGRDPET